MPAKIRKQSWRAPACRRSRTRSRGSAGRTTAATSSPAGAQLRRRGVPEQPPGSIRQTSQGSFSAVSKRNFARKYAFDSIFQALQDLHTSAPLQSQNFSKNILANFSTVHREHHRKQAESRNKNHTGAEKPVDLSYQCSVFASLDMFCSSLIIPLPL